MDEEEIILQGLPISRGIGIGSPVYFALTHESDLLETSILQKEVEEEIARYRKALDLSRKDLERLQEISLKEGSSEICAILGTHLEMMRDPMLTTTIEERIREKLQNTESIFLSFIEEYKRKFYSLEDSYFQERVRDILDVSHRILGYLNPHGFKKMAEVPDESIILTHELVPSETVEASSSAISGFVTAAGGVTSHAAIIARAKGIPYVANVDMKQLRKVDVKALIVDGMQGLVIINPTQMTLKKYHKIKRALVEYDKKLKSALHLKGETVDGYHVRIFANIENPQEIALLKKQGAEGVGLFRSEYLVLSQKRFPSEEEQFLTYVKMVRSLKDKPLVIRIFDIGGDKKAELDTFHPDHKYFTAIGDELNPSMGCRAIRFLLRYPDILDAQLKAILRASAFGPVQILIPMVSDLSEVVAVNKRIRQLKEEFAAKGIAVAKKIPVGCMIEVPSSAIMCDVLAQEVDFLSIGTNDLVQYVLAADRSNPNISSIYFSPHPSVLRLIRMVISSAARARKPVIVCGECAADSMMIPILMGLGIREFSVSARHIPLVKHTIRKWNILEASRVAEGALDYSSAAELRAYLEKEAVR